MTQQRIITLLLVLGCGILAVWNFNGLFDDNDSDAAGSWLVPLTYTSSAPDQRTVLDPELVKIEPFTTDSVLYEPANMDIHSDTLFVFDRSRSKVVVMTEDGRFIRTIGNGLGEGPGEVRTVQLVDATADDIFMLDAVQRRYSRFSHSGDFLGMFQQEYSPGKLSVGDAVYVLAADGRDAILKYDLEGSLLGTFGDEIREQGTLVDVLGTVKFEPTSRSLFYVSQYASTAIRFDDAGDLREVWQLVHHRPFPYTVGSRTADGNTAFRAPPLEGVASDVAFQGGRMYINTAYRNPVSESYIDVYEVSTGAYVHSIHIPEYVNDMAWLGDRLLAIRLRSAEIVSISFPLTP